jgi:hypothetical protein
MPILSFDAAIVLVVNELPPPRSNVLKRASALVWIMLVFLFIFA